MELTLHNSDTRLTVSDTVFGAAYNEPLVHQIVTAYQAAGRSGTKAQLSKGEVRGGGKKPWKQKGTGQARSGSIRSPLWRGGGKTFAAENRDFSQKVNRKMYRGAMRSILSELLRRDLLRVVDSFTVEGTSTQAFKAKLAEMGLKSVTIVANEHAENLFLSARNVPYVSLTDVHGMDPVSLLASEHVVVTTDAVKKIEEWLA